MTSSARPPKITTAGGAAIAGYDTVQMVRKYTAKKRKALMALASLDGGRRKGDSRALSK